ncbi:MAG: YezD family protein [Phycisphaeraceae bacterium]
MQSLRYGTIQLTVHDGRVVQVDFTERTRLEYPATAKGGDQPGQGH